MDPGRDTRLGTVTRAATRYMQDGMAERAPAIAYYGVLSLFPAVIAAFAVVRLVAGESAADDIAQYALDHGASGAVADAVRSAVKTAQGSSSSAAGVTAVLGLLTLIYGASRAFTASGRALDAIGRHLPQPRSLRRRAQDVGWTLVLLAIGIVAAVLATVSGRVLDELLGLVGAGHASGTIWALVRWPLAALLGFLIIAIVRWAAPTGGRRPFRPISTGRLVTLGALAIATAGFNLYVSHLGTYNATYGAFAGGVILMLWIWMAGSILLFGAELDAVLEEREQRAASPETADAGSRGDVQAPRT